MTRSQIGWGLLGLSLISGCSSDPAPAPSPTPTTSPTTPVAAPTTPIAAGTTPPPTTPGPTTPPVTTPQPNTPPAGGSCSQVTGNPTCDACIQQSCCQQVLACDANADCVALDTCLQKCTTEQCDEQCFQQHPQGGQLFDVIYQCLDTACMSQCPMN